MYRSARLASRAARPLSNISRMRLRPQATSLFVQLATRSFRQQYPLQAALSKRWNSSLTTSPSDNPEAAPRPSEPSYQLTFTCSPCKERSSHFVTKHGYHKGTVLIQCPSCKARHLISDHLGIFVDEASTLEDILAKAAEPGSDVTKLLRKGRLGMRQGELVGVEGDEDIEFWDDGTQTLHDRIK